MKDFVEKRDLDEERLKPGKVAKLLREIINATRRGGQITITFSSGVGYEESLVLWETEEIEK